MDKRRYLYFDIETAGAYGTLSEMKENDIRQYNLFLHKQARFSEKDETWRGKPEDVYLKKCALQPEYGRVVCISYGFFLADGKIKIDSLNDMNEETIMHDAKKLFDLVFDKSLVLCGYNIKGFDIPFLFKKFLSYNIVPPKNINFFNKKPWEVDCLDLQELWKNNSQAQIASFDEFAYSLGVKSPKDELMGVEVHKTFYEDKDYAAIKKYCEKDVKCCVDCVEVLENLIV